MPEKSGYITPSNKSPQSTQAAAQHMEQGVAMKSGHSAMNKRGPTRQNGKLGKPSFR